jgi:hypothetical protein
VKSCSTVVSVHQLFAWNTTVYSLAVHCAATVISVAGIVTGRLGVHPLNVYPSLVGAVGAVIAVP